MSHNKDNEKDTLNETAEEFNTEIKEETVAEDSTKQSDSEKIKELEEKVIALEKESLENKDRFLRKAAEFENYKRRTENEQLNLLKYAAEPFIKKILSVVDDFERSQAHINETTDIQAVNEGIKMIYDKLVKTLEEQGVTKIKALNEPFNVDFHEALMQRKAEGTSPNTVVDEIEAGYIYKDKVIRHSKVVVSEDSEENQAMA